MTAPSLTFVQAVRDFLDLDVDSTSKYTDQTIASNIRTASWFLERATNRLFGDYSGVTRKYTTNGAVYLTIPGLRTATSVTWASAALTADTSYWLIPDSQQTGVYTGIQLAGFGSRSDGPDYLDFPDWFDTNKDSPKWSRGRMSSMPNDLVIVGDWGYTDANLPEPARNAAKVLAAFYTKYPDAVLVASIQTANDGSIDYSGLPLPVQEFIASWSVAQGSLTVASLQGYRQLNARLTALKGAPLEINKAITIHGVANAKNNVHRISGNLGRTIRPGTVTAEQAEIRAGGRLHVGYAGAEELGRKPVTIRPKPGRRGKNGGPAMLAWGGPRTLGGRLRVSGGISAKPTNFAREVHQKARRGHPYLRPGLQKAAKDQGVETIVKIWNGAA